jgi:hypothetical protein
MTAELSRIAKPLQLALPMRSLIDLVSYYENAIERDLGTVYISVEIAPSHRTQLKSRLNEIEAVCRPDDKFDSARVDGAISYMIGMFNVGRNISKAEAAATAKGYRVALAGIPVFFVERAAMDFVQGKVEGHDLAFTPTSAEVRVRCVELMTPFQIEAAKLRLILIAKQRIRPTGEEHERLLAKTRAVLDGTDPEIKAIKDRIEAERAEQRTLQAIRLGRTNEIQRRRYCVAHGMDPDSLVTPSLTRLLESKNNGPVQDRK